MTPTEEMAAEGFRLALETARALSTEIFKLGTSHLSPGETLDERMCAVAALSIRLAETWLALDALMDTFAALRNLPQAAPATAAGDIN